VAAIKALSLWQPWATLVAAGIKRVEAIQPTASLSALDF
jgi:hypothetical protein